MATARSEAAGSNSEEAALKSKRKLLTPILVGLLLTIVVLMVVASRSPQSTFVPPAIPSPNGISELMRATQMLSPRTGFFLEMDEEELAQVVEQNRPALKVARSAFKKEIAVPVDWEAGAMSGANATRPFAQSLRKLGRAFAAEARQHLIDDNATAAAGSALDGFRLGTKSGQGGLIVDYLVGLAIQMQAIESLKSALPAEPELNKRVASDLLELAKSAETVEDVIARETAYIENSLTGFQGWLYRRNLTELLEPSLVAARQASLRETARRRLFVTHLAIQTFRQQKSTLPETLAELSPSILEFVPRDPYTSGEFVYRTTDDSYQLYSLGSNLTDDEGVGDATGDGLDFVYDITSE